MKVFYLTLVLSLWATFSHAQKVEWVALPEQHGSKAKLIYQTIRGDLLAVIDYNNQYVFSKDDGKTWQPVIIPNAFPYYYLYFTSDTTGNMICFGKNKIFKFDTSNYEFKPYLTLDSKNWVSDIAFKDGKMYVLASSTLLIYDAKTLNLLTYSKDMQNCSSLLLGKGGQNIALTYLTPSYTYAIYSFDDNDLKATYQNTLPFKPFSLNSGVLVCSKKDTMLTSSDFGKSWQPLAADRNANYFYVNRQKEIIINNQGKFELSADEGKTWENISYPKDKFLNVYWLENPRKQLVFENNSCHDATLYISKDMGKTWSSSSFLIGKPICEQLLITPKDEILTSNCYEFKQIKGKNDWEDISPKDSIQLNLNSLFIIFPSGKWMTRNKYNKYCTSMDNGKNWVLYNNFPPFPNPPKDPRGDGLAFHYSQKKELFCTIADDSYLSKDEGKTWEKMKTKIGSIGNNNLCLTLNNYQYFIYKEEVSFSFSFFNIYDSNNKTSNEIYAINGQAIYQLSAFVTLNDDKFCFVSYQDSNSDNTYLHSSTDFGKTFISKKVSIEKNATFKSLIKGKDNSLILITTKDVLISFDEGNTWISIKNNLPSDSGVLYNTAVLSSDQHLFIGTRGEAIYRTKMPLSKTIAVKESVVEVFDVQLFPNPTEDILNLQLLDNELNKPMISIFSLEGKLLKEQFLQDKYSTIDLDFLPKGMYLLQATNQGKNILKKFVKL
jgi:photosystem II stability/assembly factor-like uncharacterized protein